MARVLQKDPAVIILMVLEGEKLVGHVIAEVIDRVVWLPHCYSSRPGVIDKMLKWADIWCRNRNYSTLRIEAPGDKPEVYARLYGRHGFKLKYYVMERIIN